MADRWRFLRPWCAPLRGRLRLLLDESAGVPSSRCRALTLELVYARRDSAGTGADLRQIRDALVLLALLQRVDPRAYVATLVSHCELELELSSELGESDELLGVPFRIAFGARGGTDASVRRLQKLFAGLNDPPTPFFCATARNIVGFAPRRMETPIQADIKIRVVIETAGEGDSGHGLRIYKLLKELKTAHDGWRLPVCTELAFKCDSCSPCDPPAFKCAFVLELMETEHFSGPLVLQTVNVLEEIAMSRVQVPVSRMALSTDVEDGCLLNSYVESSQAIRTLGSVFERVLCTENLCGNETTMMDEVIISCSLGKTWLAGRLCTALATTRTTNGLQINFKHAPTFRDLEFGSQL